MRTLLSQRFLNILLIVGFVFSGTLFSQSVAVVTKVKGNVEVRRGDSGASFNSAKAGELLNDEDFAVQGQAPLLSSSILMIRAW